MKNTAITPVPKLEEDFYDWYARHEQVKETANAPQNSPGEIAEGVQAVCELMVDAAHPNSEGYQIIAESIEPVVAELLGGQDGTA